MTDLLIKKQIKIIEKATQSASKSKEKAFQFLKKAGIIESSKSTSQGLVEKSKKKI